MPDTKVFNRATIGQDLIAGVVVFLVALPLSLGIALASNAPLISGLVAGILGGIVVGIASGSHASVSGPAAGLTAVVAFQITKLGSFEAFLAAVIIGGGIQIMMGAARAGGISSFVPSSVIKGLLAAIGVILILKQIPHLLGRDTDPEGEMSFFQPDAETTFSELGELLSSLHPGAASIGIASLALLWLWDYAGWFQKIKIPAPLVVVTAGILLQSLFSNWGPPWIIEPSHLVQVPVAKDISGFFSLLPRADLSQFSNPAAYVAGLTIALVASIETLLNLEAVDKLSKKLSPPNRELFAQGFGNILSGFLGGLPMTSVIVRSSVNINAGGKTKLSAIVHGFLLAIFVVRFPDWLNIIPLSCLAAILLHTGFKLANPKLVRQMWRQGRYQFAPFIITVTAIVMTDLLTGVLIGLAVSVSFILNSNLRSPIRQFVEKHLSGDVIRIQLAEQVSFLHRGAIEKALFSVPRGGRVLLDAEHTDFIEPDVLSLIREFRDEIAPSRNIQVSLSGFRNRYRLPNEILFVDYSTREVQEKMTPRQVLDILRDGNLRFRRDQRLTRDLGRQVHATATSQHPLAVVLSCIDSRAPAELILDAGLGEILNVRVAGNVTSPKVLGSIEYSCAVAGAKLVLVMGHTRCGAVTAAVQDAISKDSVVAATGCTNLESILTEIQHEVDFWPRSLHQRLTDGEMGKLVDQVAEKNVAWSARRIMNQSPRTRELVESGRVAIVGAIYDVATGEIRFLPEVAFGLDETPAAA